MLPEYVVYISIFTSIFAGYFYIRDTLLGKTKPNLVSWFIWFIAPFIAALISLNKGAGVSVIPIFMATFTPLCVVLIGLFKKNAYWKFSTLDYVCLALSLLALAFWVFLEEGNLSTTFAVLADLIAFVPTFIKSWHHPETETIGPYISGSFNSALSILTLKTVTYATAGFASYLLLGNLFEIILLLSRRKFLKKKGIL